MNKEIAAFFSQLIKISYLKIKLNLLKAAK